MYYLIHDPNDSKYSYTVWRKEDGYYYSNSGPTNSTWSNDILEAMHINRLGTFAFQVTRSTDWINSLNILYTTNNYDEFFDLPKTHPELFI